MQQQLNQRYERKINQDNGNTMQNYLSPVSVHDFLIND